MQKALSIIKIKDNRIRLMIRNNEMPLLPYKEVGGLQNNRVRLETLYYGNYRLILKNNKNITGVITIIEVPYQLENKENL